MPLLSTDKLVRALSAGELGGVFFLFGDEEFLKEECATRIVEAHLDPATRDFNLDQLRGGDTEIETLASILETPPMMAEWRVVVVREAQLLAGSARTRALIENLFARPLPGLAVVLLAQLPERTRAQFYEVLKKKARAVEFASLSAADAPGWLMERAAAQGLELAPNAARALTEAIGPEVGVLERELSKLADFVGERRTIAVADVEQAVGVVARQNRWEWFDLVGDARFAEARAGLRVLLDGKENGVGLVLGLGTQFLRLALVAAGGERALQDELPPHQRWLAGRLARAARRWSTDALEAALEDLLRADRLLKSSSLSEVQILDELLLRLQARHSARSAA